MIGDKHITAWLTSDPVGLVHKLADEAACNADLKTANEWKDDVTGDSILHALFTNVVFIKTLCTANGNININLNSSMHALCDNLCKQDYSIINRTNNNGDTPLDSVLNIKQSELEQHLHAEDPVFGIGIALRKTDTLYIISCLISKGIYCKINGCDEDRNQFLFDAAMEKITPVTVTLGDGSVLTPSLQNPFHSDKYLTCLVTNMLFSQDNIAYFSLTKDLASLAIAAGYLKETNPLFSNFTTVIHKQCIAQGVYKHHFTKYVKNGIAYHKIQYDIAPNVLRDIQIVLHNFYEGFVDSNSETEKQCTALVAESKSTEDMFTALRDENAMMHVMRFLARIPRCFTDQHSKIMGYVMDRVLVRSQKGAIFFTNSDAENSLHNILSNAIENNNNIILKKVVDQIGHLKQFISLACKTIMLNHHFQTYYSVKTLMQTAVAHNNHEAAEILLETGISPNLSVPNYHEGFITAKSTVIEAQNNPTPEMQALFAKYWFCSSRTIQTIENVLVNINRGLIVVGAAASGGVSSLFLNNSLTASFFLSGNFVTCGVLYCTVILTSRYLTKYPEILPDTMSWIMRSVEKLWHENDQER